MTVPISSLDASRDHFPREDTTTVAVNAFISRLPSSDWRWRLQVCEKMKRRPLVEVAADLFYSMALGHQMLWDTNTPWGWYHRVHRPTPAGNLFVECNHLELQLMVGFRAVQIALVEPSCRTSKTRLGFTESIRHVQTTENDFMLVCAL